MRQLILALVTSTFLLFAYAAPASDVAAKIENAKNGDSRAQSEVGFMYYEGKVLPKDPEQAIYWTKMAADAVHVPAIMNLAYFYKIGFGVSKDSTQAIALLEKVGRAGNANGYYNIGSMYALGEGVEASYEKAKPYFEKAAAMKHVPALSTLGGMHMNGQGVQKNPATAIEYFKKAAQLGDVDAMLDLGKIYANGIGVARDFAEARAWYTLAVEGGSKAAQTALKELPRLEATAAEQEKNKNALYIQKLRQKYAARIKYDTAAASKAVKGFNLDCQAKDRRYLPLEHLLLAKLSSLDESNGWLTIRVDSRGDDVRLYDELVRADGRVIDSRVAFELNRWGELRSMNGRMEAVRNACFGSQGPIWIVPKD